MMYGTGVWVWQKTDACNINTNLNVMMWWPSEIGAGKGKTDYVSKVDRERDNWNGLIMLNESMMNVARNK